MTTASVDSLEDAGRRIALFVAASQPFYPLTMWWVGGRAAAQASAVVLIVTPLFLLVPLAARRWPGSGRILLAAAGTLVTILAAWSLGRASWAEAYHLPVLLVGLTLFRLREQGPRLIAVGLPMACLLALHGTLPPGGWLDPDVSSGLAPVHLGGAAGLSLYILWQARGAWRS